MPLGPKIQPAPHRSLTIYSSRNAKAISRRLRLLADIKNW
jgi:hypothetical protein